MLRRGTCPWRSWC